MKNPKTRLHVSTGSSNLYSKILLVLLAFVLVGCDMRHPPSQTVNDDSTYDELPDYDPDLSFYPYDTQAFQTVLNHSKLQHPDNTVVVDYTAFTNVKAPYFYTDSEGILHMSIAKEANASKTRTELREGPSSWSLKEGENHTFSATLQCLKPKPGITSYTWMQIHGTTETYNYPILRLLWQREYKNLYDHLWAILIVSDPYQPTLYQWIDLGPRPEGYFTCEVIIEGMIMSILINHEPIDTHNISYWANVDNYFKAGVYIDRYEDGGEVSVLFKSLEY